MGERFFPLSGPSHKLFLTNVCPKMLDLLSDLRSWVGSQVSPWLGSGTMLERIGLLAGLGFLTVLLADVLLKALLGEMPEWSAGYFARLIVASVLGGTLVHYAEKDGLFSFDFSHGKTD